MSIAMLQKKLQESRTKQTTKQPKNNNSRSKKTMSKGRRDNTTQKQNLLSKSRIVGRRREKEKDEKCMHIERGRTKKRRGRNELRKTDGDKKKKRARIITFQQNMSFWQN